MKATLILMQKIIIFVRINIKNWKDNLKKIYDLHLPKILQDSDIRTKAINENTEFSFGFIYLTLN